MTEDTRKTWYWTGGVTAAIVAIVIVLWFAGALQAPTVAQ